MLKNADIIIIGAGIIGAAIASCLSQKTNSKILMLEQNQESSGSTSLSASMITKLRHQTNLIPLIEETHRAVNRMEDKFGRFTDKKQVGCMHVAASEESVKNLNTLTEIAQRHRIPFEAIQNNTIQKKIPWLNSEKIAKAIFIPDEFFVDGTTLGRAFINEAKQNGVEYKNNTQVLQILTDSGKVTGVKTNKENIYAPVVVIAAGVWSNLLLTQIDTLVPCAPVRSLYFTTEKNPELYPKDQPICILPDANIYSRPEKGRLLFGIRDKNSPWIHPENIKNNFRSQAYISLEEQREILLKETKDLKNLMQNFDALKIERTVAAPCAYTHDSNPAIGELPNIEGLFIATGCNGGGIATSAGFGRLTAELVLKEKPFVNSEEFKPDRVKNINPFSEEFMNACSKTRSGKRSG